MRNMMSYVAISFTLAATGVGPYDGGDDALVGIVNNSGKTLTSLKLSGAGNGGGVFAFDALGWTLFHFDQQDLAFRGLRRAAFCIWFRRLN